MQSITEKTAGVLGAVFLLGAPLALAQIGWPLEPGELSWPVVLMHLRALTLPTSFLLAALVVLVAGAWCAYALATAADLVRIVRGRAPRLALARLAAALLTAAATGSAVASPAAAAVSEPAASAASSTAYADTSEEDSQPGIERHRTFAGFALDSAQLDADMRTGLDSAAELIRSYGDTGQPIAVTGHTDPTGSDAYNQRLSQRRAESAAAYLRSALGEKVSFTVEGAGSVQPPADGAASNADLRRVEIDYRIQPPAASPPADEHTTGPDDAVVGEAPNAPAETAETGLTASDAAALGVTAVAGAAGLAGAYTLGRRTRRPLPKGPQSESEEPGADAVLAEPVEEAPAPSAAAPAEVRKAALAHQVRLGPTLTVDAAYGLAITGPGAAGIVTALLARTAREAPGSVIATRAALDKVDCIEGTNLPGVIRASGIESALVRVEAHLVAAQRATDEDAEDVSAYGLPTVLVEGPGEGPAHERLRSTLNAGLTEKPTVIALADLGQGTSVHAEDERLTITETDGTVRDLPADSVWRQAPDTAEEPPPAEEPPELEPHPPGAPDAATPASPQPQNAEQGAVVLRLFAPRVEVRVAGCDVSGRMRAAARLLLAYLAIHPRGATGDEIGELLAPGADPARARSARNNAISSARSTIRTTLGTTETPVVETAGQRYRLQNELFDVDLWQFIGALDRAKKATGDARTENRRTALECYVGELLSDISDGWVEAERHRCRRSAAQTCIRLAEDANGMEEKVSWLERACAIDPYNEMVHRMLADAHAENNDPDAMHGTYQRLNENLRRIGERPSKDFRVLVEKRTSVAPLRAGAPS